MAKSDDAASRAHRGRPGPKPSLDVDRIVLTAIAVADEEGLGAVSMANVAKRLGFTPMSLYRHVDGKDDLLTRMADTAIGPPPSVPPAGLPAGWRAGLSAWTTQYLFRALEHPWVVNVPIAGPPTTLNALLWMEQALGAMAGTALAEDEKTYVIMLLNSFARSQVSLIAGLRHAAALPTDAPPPQYDETLRAVIDPEQFPALSRAIDSGIFAMPTTPGDDGTMEDFLFGLGIVLDGVTALVAAKEAAGRADR